jgi:hypothetical protein
LLPVQSYVYLSSSTNVRVLKLVGITEAKDGEKTRSFEGRNGGGTIAVGPLPCHGSPGAHRPALPSRYGLLYGPDLSAST